MMYSNLGLSFRWTLPLRITVAPELASREDLHPAGRVLSLALGLTDRQLCLTKTQTTGHSNKNDGQIPHGIILEDN